MAREIFTGEFSIAGSPCDAILVTKQDLEDPIRFALLTNINALSCNLSDQFRLKEGDIAIPIVTRGGTSANWAKAGVPFLEMSFCYFPAYFPLRIIERIHTGETLTIPT